MQNEEASLKHLASVGTWAWTSLHKHRVHIDQLDLIVSGKWSYIYMEPNL